MCLDKIDKKPTVKEGIGYKLFFGESGGLITCCGKMAGAKVGEWIKDDKKSLLPYLTGFHLYQTEEDAKRSGFFSDSIHKVKFRDVTATGKEGGLRVIVAREIYILPDKV